MSSIFVRDLHQNVTESTLYKKFSSIGPLLSLRVCREAGSNRSLGYAYVNFVDRSHATQAIKTMNFEMLEGKPIQVVRYERDPLVRKSHQPNVFVKNLDKSVTNRELYLAFSQFGNVISAKVAKDQNGISKCHGFVQFEDDDSALRSIFALNGSMIKNKILCVQRFVQQKTNGVPNDSKQKFTNIYVKNIDKGLSDQGLREMFGKFGKVISPKVMTDSEGKSRGFGFVSFGNTEAAQNAISEMNGRILPNGKTLYVCRAQKKNEREITMEIHQQESGHDMGNLCVSNLDDSVDDDLLRKEFQSYGTVITAKVILKHGRSIGIGYVRFSRPDDAVKAIAAMNGRIIATKPIIVYLTDAIRSSFGEKRLLGARSHRPNWLEIADATTLQTNGVVVNGNELIVSEEISGKRKPDMATVYRMLSPPDISETRTLSFQSV